MPDDEFPRDVWVDVETGDWGLAKNLRLLRQTELPQEIGNKKLAGRVKRALLRCAAIDNGAFIPGVSRR